jgi:hypothetical protein
MTTKVATMTDQVGWFAEECYYPEEEAPLGMSWAPTLQIPGFCFSLDIRFENAEGCGEFIRKQIIGKGELREKD